MVRSAYEQELFQPHQGARIRESHGLRSTEMRGASQTEQSTDLAVSSHGGIASDAANLGTGTALWLLGLGIVSKGVREPVDRLTLFGGTFSSAILSKAIHYKYIGLLYYNEGTLKSVNLLSRSVRQS